MDEVPTALARIHTAELSRLYTKWTSFMVYELDNLDEEILDIYKG
jgi:hypothetical protein